MKFLLSLLLLTGYNLTFANENKLDVKATPLKDAIFVEGELIQATYVDAIANKKLPNCLEGFEPLGHLSWSVVFDDNKAKHRAYESVYKSMLVTCYGAFRGLSSDNSFVSPMEKAVDLGVIPENLYMFFTHAILNTRAIEKLGTEKSTDFQKDLIDNFEKSFDGLGISSKYKKSFKKKYKEIQELSKKQKDAK